MTYAARRHARTYIADSLKTRDAYSLATGEPVSLGRALDTVAPPRRPGRYARLPPPPRVQTGRIGRAAEEHRRLLDAWRETMFVPRGRHDARLRGRLLHNLVLGENGSYRVPDGVKIDLRRPVLVDVKTRAPDYEAAERRALATRQQRRDLQDRHLLAMLSISLTTTPATAGPSA